MSRISQATIDRYNLSTAAVEVLEATGFGDDSVHLDALMVRTDADDGANLLSICLDGADDDYIAGWNEYVDALVADANSSETEAQARDFAADDSDAAWEARERSAWDGREEDAP
jgi:hypothetical protein